MASLSRRERGPRGPKPQSPPSSTPNLPSIIFLMNGVKKLMSALEMSMQWFLHLLHLERFSKHLKKVLDPPVSDNMSLATIVLIHTNLSKVDVMEHSTTT